MTEPDTSSHRAMGDPSNSAGLGVGRELLARGSSYTAARALQFVSSLVVLPVVVRLLPPAAYGEVGSAMVVLQFLALVLPLGVPAALTREYFAESGKRNAGGLVTASAVLCVTGALVVLATGPIWSQMFGDIGFGWSLRIAVISAAGLGFVTACQAQLQAAGEVSRFVAVTLLATVGSQATGLLLTSIERSPAAYMAGTLAGIGGAATLGAVACRPRRLGRSDRPLLHRALSVGGPSVPHALGLVVLAVGDRVVIERILGLGGVGQYQAAYALGTVGLAALIAFNSAWAPLIYGLKDSVRWTVLARTTSSVICLVSCGTAATALVFTALAPAVVPAGYDSDLVADVTAVVAFSAVPYAIYLSGVHVLFQERRTFALVLITPMSAALNLVLNVFVVDEFGLRGAAATTVWSYALQGLLVRIAARRLAVVPWNLGGDIRWMAVAGGGCAIAYATPPTATGLILRAVAAALFAAVGFRAARRMDRITG